MPYRACIHPSVEDKSNAGRSSQHRPIYTSLDLVPPPVPVGTSGDEVLPSLAVTGDLLCTSPCYSKTLQIFCERRTPNLLWSSYSSLVLFWFPIHGYVCTSLSANDQPVSSSVLSLYRTHGFHSRPSQQLLVTHI